MFLKALPPAWRFVPSLTFHAWSPKSSESQGAGPGAERDQAELRAEKMGKRGLWAECQKTARDSRGAGAMSERGVSESD